MEAELIDPLRGRILGVAEISGNVDEVLEKISSQYDEEVSQRLAALSQIIETVLIVLLAIFVGAILLAIMAPLIDIISSIA
jgi:type IV pilus assembly protein PilC